MREFAKVPPVVWTGPIGKHLRKLTAAGDMEASIIAMYLLTSQHSRALGIYYLPVGYISMDTGIPLEGAIKGLKSLCEGGFCTYEEASEYVFVHDMVLWQIGPLVETDNRVKGIHKELDLIPDGPLKTSWLEKHCTTYHIHCTKTNPKPLKSPSEGVKKPPIIEGEGEGEKKETLCAPQAEHGWQKPAFAEFWEELCATYPSRGKGESKGTTAVKDKVRNYYAKVHTFEQYDEILAAARSIAAWADWMEATKPHWDRKGCIQMSRWVNEMPKRGRWLDHEHVVPEDIEKPAPVISSGPIENEDYFVNDDGQKIDLLTNRPFDEQAWRNGRAA
ncbi:MAG TPA: hypothetical protein VK171_07535 [Fimbriimonas sp.]|nr:hypothetical protein [Fimbriimonas sp.]